MDGDEPPRAPRGDFELVVHVGNVEAAEAAAEAGAEAIYLGGDNYVRHRTAIAVEWLSEFAPRMAGRGVRVAALGPRVGDERDLAEWRWRLRQLARIRSLAVGVSNLGALQVAREMRMRDILADFSMNVCNSVAADELSTLGATRVTASIELSFLEMGELICKSRMPVEVIGQGALPGMVLEHCMIAAATGDTPQGVCPMNCRRGTYDLCDATGQAFRIETDRRCRNHIFLPADVCVLPNLSRLAATGAAGLRIEAPFEDAAAVAVIVGVYRQAIDALRKGLPFDASEGVARISAATGRRQSDGPFAFHLVSEDVKEGSGVIQSADGG